MATHTLSQDERTVLKGRAVSVATVTVAYNGAHVLESHLAALQRQTQQIQEIVVVNNASEDNTLGLLASRFPDVTVINLPANAGVGGGLTVGLEYAALRKKYDWIWLFDQDSVPADNGLELLLAGLDHLNGDTEHVAILAPVCEDESTKMSFPGLIWEDGRTVKAPIKSDQPVTLVDLVISSGTLIRRQAVEAVGLPRADFFMDFVDFEHCLRLRRHGFAIGMVRDSHLNHAVGEPSTFKIFGRTFYWTDHVPWRQYYITRNEVFTIWQYYGTWRPKVFFFRRLAGLTLFLLLFGKEKLACLDMMWRGFSDGRAGKLGIRVPNSSS
jgi:rhamnosyltransferase